MSGTKRAFGGYSSFEIAVRNIFGLAVKECVRHHLWARQFMVLDDCHRFHTFLRFGAAD